MMKVGFEPNTMPTTPNFIDPYQYIPKPFDIIHEKIKNKSFLNERKTTIFTHLKKKIVNNI